MRATLVWLLVLAAAGAVTVGTGCRPDRFDQPIPVMLDRDRMLRHRVAAAEQLGAIEAAADRDRYRRALSEIAWSDREPIELRRIAFDRLIAHDRDAFVDDADRRITQVESFPALEHIFDHAAAGEWEAFVPVAIRSYARRARAYADRDRPEHALIATLRPDQPVEQTLTDVVLGRHAAPGDATAGQGHQVAAWCVLRRLWDRQTLAAWLESAPPETALVRDLRAASDLLEVLPATPEQVAWLMHVRQLEDGAWWERARQRVGTLSTAQRAGLALRHLPLVVEVNRALLAGDRAVLRLRITTRLRARQRVTRTRGVARAEWTEAFEDHREQLPWGDLLAIDVIQRALASPTVKRALFEQADADRLEVTSEHGGAFVREGDGWRPEAFAPAVRLHARQYVASAALIEAMHTAVAHYHFHAQRHHNADYAGPGTGDLAFAERFGCHALVFTFIDRDTLNADYYQPAGIVVDLGNITRPVASQE